MFDRFPRRAWKRVPLKLMHEKYADELEYGRHAEEVITWELCGGLASEDAEVAKRFQTLLSR